MGNTISLKEDIISSPKQHCKLKPFPVTSKPIPIKQNSHKMREKWKQKESISLPCSLENKIIKQKQDEQNSMGRQVSAKTIDGYYFTSTHFENNQNHGKQ